ncbi:alpha/beta fold hydrolase [Pararhizobium haloflavum]|uniref:alpha/beta fold hydrolase n=1 Tax=Pararhizobium haloflavum TaxID=2037914 RepID=UPI0018E4CE45|nr:alpha/beta fold hydrolase [Pararhizobium haloflavum]
MSDIKTDLIGSAPRICVDHAGSGELLLLMHGIGGNRTNWAEQISQLARHFHVVAWDARGYGGSDDYDGPLEFSDYTHDVIRVLDHFGAAKAHIAGLSMGGRIAMDLAEKYPDRILSLTLIDTHPGFGHLSEEKKAEFIRLRKEPLMNGMEPKDIAGPVAKTLIGPKASEAAYQRLVESMTALHKESYIKSIEATVRSPNHERLEDIRVPTHVIVGEDDRLTPPDIGRHIADRITGAELTIIPNAGHLVNIEQPEAFNAAMLSFLKPRRFKTLSDGVRSG